MVGFGVRRDHQADSAPTSHDASWTSTTTTVGRSRPIQLIVNSQDPLLTVSKSIFLTMVFFPLQYKTLTLQKPCFLTGLEYTPFTSSISALKDSVEPVFPTTSDQPRIAGARLFLKIFSLLSFGSSIGLNTLILLRLLGQFRCKGLESRLTDLVAAIHGLAYTYGTPIIATSARVTFGLRLGWRRSSVGFTDNFNLAHPGLERWGYLQINYFSTFNLKPLASFVSTLYV
ncbi:hypothetical protein DFH06DRAFT_1319952 [Mycena polygramma]|nr:hypothetical protein DFH06DRAFT_1319952 [Mycena polygramma]